MLHQENIQKARRPEDSPAAKSPWIEKRNPTTMQAYGIYYNHYTLLTLGDLAPGRQDCVLFMHLENHYISFTSKLEHRQHPVLHKHIFKSCNSQLRYLFVLTKYLLLTQPHHPTSWCEWLTKQQ